MDISECSLIGWEIGWQISRFRRLSASHYSVDTQRDVPLLEDMADNFTNSVLYSRLLRIKTAIILRKDFAV